MTLKWQIILDVAHGSLCLLMMQLLLVMFGLVYAGFDFVFLLLWQCDDMVYMCLWHKWGYHKDHINHIHIEYTCLPYGEYWDNLTD